MTDVSLGNAAVPLDEAGARLIVDLSALQHNYRHLAASAPDAECAVVVKANAYGLGLEPCVTALHEAGAGTFFVAQISEARRLLAAIPEAVVYILSGFAPDTAQIIASIGARPVLGCMGEIEEWASFCSGTNTLLPAALHIDTGINRLGLSYDEARALAADQTMLAKLDLSLIMSHLACADDPGHDMNATQQARFAETTALFPDVPKCLANSAATLSQRNKFDLVRPGVALFGLQAIIGSENPMHTVATLEARVIQVRDVEPGEHIGYGATFATRRPSRIAILSIGYADGYFRSLGAATGENRASCAIGGQRVPVIGRVSMDLMAIDVTDSTQTEVKRGTMVEIMGANIPADELAGLAGTIGYEVLTRLGDRFNRVYLKDGIEVNR